VTTFTFYAPYARRLPDPVFGESHGIHRHVFFCPVGRVPGGLPQDPNARVPNIRKRVYRDIEQSLLNENGEPGTFHLKHKGVTVVASKVTESGENQYDVEIGEGEGVLDGGHTYALITSERAEGQTLPEDQYVKFEILTKVPREWIPEIAGGLNTSVQVQPMSLDNLEGQFDWIKEEIRDQPYFSNIAWRENEAGEFDARDLVSLLTLFNIGLFPNDDDATPVVAYEKKSQALKLFEENPDTYTALRPILKDILVLHDTIREGSRTYWNEAGGKFGRLAFVEQKTRGDFVFPFTGKRAKFRLMNGALYPMLASFRWMVVQKNGKATWRGGFSAVRERWEQSAEELMRMTAQASTELGRNPNAIGKSRNHWSNLHARVAMRDLLAKSNAN
jgi:hypothetical protein